MKVTMPTQLLIRKASLLSRDRRSKSIVRPPPLTVTVKSKNSTPTPFKAKPKVSLQASLTIGLKYFTLPKKYPGRFSTCSSFKNAHGVSVPLLHKDQVELILIELDAEIQPILKKFRISYAALSEKYPTRGKPAMTFRVPLKFHGPKAFVHYIKLRVRRPCSPNDAKKFTNKSTLLALLFHELAHIRYMNHGQSFMWFLRDIYQCARGLGVFPKGEAHQVPSCRDWENLLFRKRGKVSDDELLGLY